MMRYVSLYLITCFIYISIQGCSSIKNCQDNSSFRYENSCSNGDKKFGDLTIRYKYYPTDKEVICDFFLANRWVAKHVLSINAYTTLFNVQIGKLKANGKLEMYIDTITKAIILKGKFDYSYAINDIESEKFIGQVAYFKTCITK